MGTENVVAPKEIRKVLSRLLNVVTIVGNWVIHPRAKTMSLADGQMKAA